MQRTSLNKLNTSRIAEWARNGEPFKAAAMSGGPGKGDAGRLDEEWATRYRKDKVTYTVYSYATPIAWLRSDGNWIVPTQKFSPTTSNHQGFVRWL
jgi:hypothetical protein